MDTILEYLESAIKNILSNKMRTALTMLGIIIGIASVIAALTIGNGMASYVSDEVNAIGGNVAEIYLDNSVAERVITDDVILSLRILLRSTEHARYASCLRTSTMHRLHPCPIRFLEPLEIREPLSSLRILKISILLIFQEISLLRSKLTLVWVIQSLLLIQVLEELRCFLMHDLWRNFNYLKKHQSFVDNI